MPSARIVSIEMQIGQAVPLVRPGFVEGEAGKECLAG